MAEIFDYFLFQDKMMRRFSEDRKFWLWFHRKTFYDWFDKELNIPKWLFEKYEREYMANTLVANGAFVSNEECKKILDDTLIMCEKFDGGIRHSQKCPKYWPETNGWNTQECERPVSKISRPNTDTAVKNDEGKLRYDLIPPEAMEYWAEVYTIGAKKYADRNWEKGMSWCRIFRAMMSHSWKWFRGEKFDLKDGQHHLASVMWCAASLIAYEARGIGTDDRVKVPSVIKEIEIET